MATFGKITNGTFTQAYTSDRKIVSQATPSTTGVVMSGAVRILAGSAVDVPCRMVIYSNNAGEPDALLAVSDDTLFNSTTEIEVPFLFSGVNEITVTSGTPYWVGVMYDYTTATISVSRDNTAGLTRSNNDTYADGATNPFGAVATTAGAIDAYITYRDDTITKQILTIDGNGTDVSGWVAEGGDFTRMQSDDGDTTRLYSPVSGQVRQFTITDTSALSGATINAVTVYMKYRSLDPVPNTFQIGIRSGGVDYWSTDKDTVSSTSYIMFSHKWAINPNTSAAWTTAAIDAMEVGVKKINAVGGAVTYGYVEVDYTTGGGGGGSPTPSRLMLMGVG